MRELVPYRALIFIGCIALAGTAATSASAPPPAPVANEPLASALCAGHFEDWMQSARWPTDELVLGDQIYDRNALWNLNMSRGNAIADLALAMASAQLNVAAGAAPPSNVIDALFEADQWLLDGQPDQRRSQVQTREIAQVLATLRDFNDQAVRTDSCAPPENAA